MFPATARFMLSQPRNLHVFCLAAASCLDPDARSSGVSRPSCCLAQLLEVLQLNADPVRRPCLAWSQPENDIRLTGCMKYCHHVEPHSHQSIAALVLYCGCLIHSYHRKQP